MTAASIDNFRSDLFAVGCSKGTVDRAVKIGGDMFPIFGKQLKGCYIDEDGKRYPHFALPGWYRIQSVNGIVATIISTPTLPTSRQFECNGDQIAGVLGANLGMYER